MNVEGRSPPTPGPGTTMTCAEPHPAVGPGHREDQRERLTNRPDRKVAPVMRDEYANHHGMA